MQFSFKNLFFALISLMLLYSCSEDETIIGSGIHESGALNVKKLIDTDINAYTIYDDSLLTKNHGSVLGFYRDNVFGSVSAGIYSQMSLRGASADFSPHTFDSLTLDMQISGVYSNSLSDESPKVYLQVYQLSDEIKVDSNYYSTNSAQYNPTPLFEGEVTLSTDSVTVNGEKTAPHFSVRLKDEFMNLLHENFTSNKGLYEKTKGLYFRVDPSRSDNAMAYINFALDSSLTGVKLHYKEKDSTSAKVYTFSLGKESFKFSEFKHDYSGTALSVFTSNPKDSIAKSPYLYIQSLGGTLVRVKIPGLKDKSKYPEKMIINEANLILPLADINPDNNPPSQLYCAMYKEDGTVGAILDYFDGTYDSSKKQYRICLTRHIQNLLYGTIDDWGLLVYINGRGAIANRCVIDGNNAVLEVYYSE